MVRKSDQLILLLILMLTVGCNQINPKNDRSLLSGERFPAPIALTAADIKWFRDFGVSWIFSENGAPALILPNLSLEEQAELYDGTSESRLLLDRFERTFTTFAVYGKLKPGVYSIEAKKIIGESPLKIPAKSMFEVTQTHIDLMRSAWWREGFIDFKYPYGNYRYYEADMAIKLGEQVPINKQTGVFELNEFNQKKYQRLHHELVFALLVFVIHAEIEPGNYQLPVDGWKSSLFRLSPPTKQQIKRYILKAIELKKMFAKGQGDKVIDWIKLNQEFSMIID